MTLDELIFQRISENEYFGKALTPYAERPAVFYQTAPDDKQPGWGKEQYPRIVYTIDMLADTERKSAGVMQVDLYCDESKTAPEEIEPHIRECLVNLIVKPDGNSHFAFAWARTEMFTLEQRNSEVGIRVIGASIRFDILEYSLQETTNPDPAKALSRWLKKLAPESLVIGEDAVEKFYEPSAERPAFYVRVQSRKTNRTTFALSWQDCLLAVHVIAPEPESRNLWTRYLADCLDIAGEVILLDDSPMLIHEVAADNAADYLTQGQISVKTEYSLPRLGRVVDPLHNIITKGGISDMAVKKTAEGAQAVISAEAKDSPVTTAKNAASGDIKARKQSKSVYTANEFVKAAETAFDRPYSRDIVRAALRCAGLTSATWEQADKAIKDFLGGGKQ